MRALLFGPLFGFLSGLLALSFAPGCAPRVEADEPARATRASVARLDYVELITGGAEKRDRLPTLLAIHGLGDTPENFARIFEYVDFPARVILPRAPLPYSGGSAWTTVRVRDGDEAALDAALRDRVAELAALLEALERRPEIEGPFFITGFSQGGILSFALTLAHPGKIAKAFPVAGLLPESRQKTLPKPPKHAPAILAFHGDADIIVPYARGKALVEALAARGWDASLVTFEGLNHTLPDEVRRALALAFREAARSTASN